MGLPPFDLSFGVLSKAHIIRLNILMQTRDIYKKLCVLFGAKDGTNSDSPSKAEPSCAFS